MKPGENREYERRFLVTELSVLDDLDGDELEQGYLFSINGWKGRIRRRRCYNEQGGVVDELPIFTLKGPKRGTASPEYEMAIELPHAMQLIEAAPAAIIKTRYPYVSEGNPWVIDVFHGENEGLHIAEVEASREAIDLVMKPWWCGLEITQMPSFQNENLAERPISTWPVAERQKYGLP